MAKSGAPTRAERREQQLVDAFSTLTKVVEQQSETLERLEKKLVGDEPKEQSRTLSAQEEFQSVVMPPPANVPAIIYKIGTRGLKQVIQPSHIIQRSEGNYQIIPPLLAEFDKGTLRVSDPKTIALIDEAIARRERQGLPARIVKFKDEIAEALADPDTDVKPIESGKVTVDTPVEALIQ